MGRAPPLFPYCRVLVSHRYRTMYLKSPKTGSTSLLTLLGTCTGGPDDKPTCFEPLEARACMTCMWWRRVRWASAAAGRHRLPSRVCRGSQPACPSAARLPTRPALVGRPPARLACAQTKGVSREQYEQQYSEYFVWAAVRNPWARAVSSYRMLSRYMRRECKVRRRGGRPGTGRHA